MLATVYALWIVQRAFHGAETHGWSFADLRPRELGAFGAMIAALVLLGLYPQPVLDHGPPGRGRSAGDRRAAAGGAGTDHGLRRRGPRGRGPGRLRGVRRLLVRRRDRGLEMTASDLIALPPFIVLTAAVIVVMLAIAFWRSHALALGLTLIGLAATVGTLPVAATQARRQVTPLLRPRRLRAVLHRAHRGRHGRRRGALVRLPGPPRRAFRGVLRPAAQRGAGLRGPGRRTHFASFFLGLEILSVSLYALIAYPRLREAASRPASSTWCWPALRGLPAVRHGARLHETGDMTVAGAARLVSGGTALGVVEASARR